VLTARIDGMSKDQLIDRLSNLISKRTPKVVDMEPFRGITDDS